MDDRPVVTDVRSLQAGWPVVLGAWAPTIERARALPEAALRERVHGEFSFLETLRHLLFATDCWVRRTILSAPTYHPFGVPPDPDPVVASWGVDLGADPGLDEVLAARREYVDLVTSVVDGLEPADWSRHCDVNPAPGHPQLTDVPISMCFGVLLHEEWEHRRYAERDLDLLTAGG